MPEEPQRIIAPQPVIVDGAGGQSTNGSGPQLQARSCYINQSCPTCLPCCIALFIAPVIFLLWTLYPNWRKAQEIEDATRPRLQVQLDADSEHDAGEALRIEVEGMQFASRWEIERFIEERGIRYDRRPNGDWVALDRGQQNALVVLHNRWLELPEE